MKSYRERAIVLRSFPLAEADRIIVLLSRDSGIIRAVAKGARRTNSKFGARLQPFTIVDLQLFHGRNLDTITQAETVQSYGQFIGADYDKFAAANVMVEVAQRLTEDEERDPQQFNLLYGALAALATSDRPWRLVAASYLLRCLALAGWAPSLERCAICGAGSQLNSPTNIATVALTRFSEQQGGAVCDNCADFSAHDVEEEALALLAALARPDWGRAAQFARAEVAALSLATGFAQYHVERKLRALAVMERGQL